VRAKACLRRQSSNLARSPRRAKAKARACSCCSQRVVLADAFFPLTPTRSTTRGGRGSPTAGWASTSDPDSLQAYSRRPWATAKRDLNGPSVGLVRVRQIRAGTNGWPSNPRRAERHVAAGTIIGCGGLRGGSCREGCLVGRKMSHIFHGGGAPVAGAPSVAALDGRLTSTGGLKAVAQAVAWGCDLPPRP